MAVTSSPSVVTESSPITGDWHVDAEQSHARFVAATLRGAVKVRGAFGSLSGNLVTDAQGTRGTLSIDAASVDTGNRVRDHHLRGRDFFGVRKYPQLCYELHSLEQGPGELVRLEGDLLIVGTRTALPLEGTLRRCEDGSAEIACRTSVDRFALGVRGSRALVPRGIDLDVSVLLRPASGAAA